MNSYYLFFRDLKIITQVTGSKFRELVAGVDGYMVYDMAFVPIMKKVYTCISVEKFMKCVCKYNDLVFLDKEH